MFRKNGGCDSGWVGSVQEGSGVGVTLEGKDGGANASRGDAEFIHLAV